MHPFVKILTFTFMVLLMNFIHGKLLFCLCLLVVCLAMLLEFKYFIVVIKRMRLFFVSIFIIYAFATPGEYLEFFSTNFILTYEGLGLGFVQIEKLVISLAALSLLLSTNSKEELMVGLYMLLSPLKFLGINADRFAARLLLTFEYVEVLASAKTNRLSFSQLEEMQSLSEEINMDRVVVLPSLSFNLLDKLLMAMISVLLFVLILFKVMA